MRFMSTQGAIVNPLLSSKFLAAAAVAIASLGAASAAHARSDVYFSVGGQGAPVYMEPEPAYVQPPPVYVRPRPVYVQPRPVYVQPPVYADPAETYERPWSRGYDAEAAYEQERAWRRAEWRRRHWRHHHHDWDQYQSRDRDWDN